MILFYAYMHCIFQMAEDYQFYYDQITYLLKIYLLEMMIHCFSESCIICL